MIALYIHWPFCLSKCPYCDFNSYQSDTVDQETWRRAYRRELEAYAALLPEKTVHSVYFGGGTPSLMEAGTVDSVLQDVARLWPVSKDAEITLEANPSSSDAEKFTAFRKAGVNRLSLGVQALDDDVLKFLGRAHNAEEARKAIRLASKIFPRISFDLIYAYKGHTTSQWKKQLDEALALGAGHLSLYQLTVEPHTVFGAKARHGEAFVTSDEEAAVLFELTQETTASAGLRAYEISNHARKGQESRHNLAYWHYDDYIGMGPGAHGRIRLAGERHATENYRKPQAWIERVEKLGRGTEKEILLTEAEAMREAVIMGLRLTEGIAFENWRSKFSVPLMRFLTEARIARLEKEGFIKHDEKSLRATGAGRQRLNAVLDFLL